MTKRTAAAVLAAGLLVVASRGSVIVANMDTSVKPQDDFFRYANGTWIKTMQIPAEYSRWTSFDALQVRNVEELNELCKGAAAKAEGGTPAERMVGDFYASGMDEAAAEASGAAPLKPELERIARVASPDEIMEEIARLHAMGIPVGFSFFSSADAKDSDMNLAQLAQGGLGLPNRDYYVNDDEKSKAIREEYVEHVSKTLQLLGDAPAEADAESQAVLSLETELAFAAMTPELLRNPHASYHKMTVDDLPQFTGDIDWAAFFWRAGAPAFSEVNLEQPDFFRAFADQLSHRPASDWRSYLRWHLARYASPYLSKAFVDENFHFYSEQLNGTKVIRPRWKRVVAEVDADVGEQLGQLYVAAYFPPEAKAQVLELVANLRSALREDLQSLSWMDEATRQKAVAKLDAYGVKMGYPDKWRDYSALTIDRGPYVLNVLRADAFEAHRNLSKIGKPIDRSEWEMTAPTVNAYYSPQRTEIVFPAGILQKPFFDPKADLASNYGAVGAVIGHEMTHGFDDRGRQYDPKGNLTDWWSAQSANRFKEKADVIVKQFDAYTVLDGLHLKGQRTEGENIADLGGLKIAYAAMEKALAGKPRELIDGFTPEQRFFLSYASVWCGLIRPENQRLRVSTDPHSPTQFRCNGPLSNMDEFAEAFNVPEGAPMRRPESERVSIW